VNAVTRLLHAPVPLRGRTEAEAHVGTICFKLGPPSLIGAELEFLVAHREDPSVRPALGELAEALGEHAPHSISPLSPALPLPGGSAVTVEPGGQVELSSSPYPDAASLCSALVADAEVLGDRLAGRSLRPVTASADTVREPQRLLELPRYDAMEASFDRVGPYGRLMMTNTAATQVALDAGRDGGEVRARWSLLHEAGPALVAAFACSPVLRGAPAGAWASQRMRTWLELDPRRTRGPALAGGNPGREYARWALDVPLLCVRTGGATWSAPAGATFADWVDGRLDGVLPVRPNVDDLELHLSTLFPPVRACGYLEVRYLDAQPGELWRVPVAVLEALLSTAAVLDRARELAEPTVGRWRDAARLGLGDGPLRSAGAALLSLAADHAPDPALAELVHHAATRTASGAAPGEETP
jgi:glutamate--cysteine ligase